MPQNYLFTLQPTFTQGLVLGQLTILLLVGLILRYLFLDSTQNPFETSSYHPRVDNDPLIRKRILDAAHDEKITADRDVESAEWFNMLLKQVVDIYRQKLRDELPGIEGDEVARKKIEDFANKIRPSGFFDDIKIHSVDLGVSAPCLYNARTNRHGADTPMETEFDATYTDTLSLSLSTSYLFNYPMTSFARLPISLTISLSRFKSAIIITPPSPVSQPPELTLSISPNFVLDLTTTSLMGSRAKLANVPKLHELIQHQVRRVLAAQATWRIALPGLSSTRKDHKHS